MENGAITGNYKIETREYKTERIMKSKEEMKGSVIKEEDAKKKQKASASYTLRALGENIRKLKELELITEEEAKAMKEIQERTTKTWIMKNMGIEV